MALTITDRVAHAQAYRDEALDGRIGAAGLAGATLEHGLLRFHTLESGSEAARLLDLHFTPGRTEDWVPFAVDWRGRQYCRVREQGVDAVLRVDPGLLAPEQIVDFGPFLDGVLTHPAAAEVLGADQWAELRRARGIAELAFEDCLGFLLPPFAGGQFEPANVLDVPVRPYWAATADLKNQWEHRPRGAFAVDVASRDGGLSLVFDVDQDPQHSPGAGTRAERWAATTAHGPAVYNHGLARELTDEQAEAGAGSVRAAFGTPDVGLPFLLDWRARYYVREQADGQDAVVRYCPATLTRTPVADGADFSARMAAGDPALLELFDEDAKSLQCARLRLTEVPAGDALVPPVPPAVAGSEADDPAGFRLMAVEAYWWLAGSLGRVAREQEDDARLQGYMISPEGRLLLELAPGGARTAPPAPWEDTAGVPPTPFAPRFTALAETGVAQTGRDEDTEAPGDGDLARLLAWHALPGRVYNHGLFRFLGADASARAAEHLRVAFGANTADTVPVLVDWLGRYAVHEVVAGLPRLVSYDVTRDEREDLAGFQDGLQRILLTPVPRDLFDEAGYQEAREALGLRRLEEGRCVGVKVPPFLGGSETVQNLEHDSLEVHWQWHGRVLDQARALPAGARIHGVEADAEGRPVLRAAGLDGGALDPAGPGPGGRPADQEAEPAESRGFFSRMFKG